MNRIVREHYPVANLPEDLRAELGLTGTVTLTIEADTSRASSLSGTPEDASLTAILDGMKDRRSEDVEAVARVRSLRSEWSLRDEYLNRVRANNNDEADLP